MIINNVKYLTLSEYCEAVNAERSKTGLNPISEITNIAARIVVAVGIIVLVVVAFKLAAFLLTKILFPLLGGVIQILFEATSWIILLFLISRTKTFQKAYNAARGKHEEKENKNK